MQNLETDGTIETRVIPACARTAGLLRCFAYHGTSMAPAFRPGHLLYVRPTPRDVAPGDVIVFAHPFTGGRTVHRVVSITDAGAITRGDNRLHNDLLPVALDQVIGRVEMVENEGRLRRLQGGSRGLWSAQVRWVARRVGGWLRSPLRPLYRALRNSPIVRRVLGRWLSRHLQLVRLETPDGPLFKTTYRGHVVARWWPQLNRFECRKPFDLAIPRPDET